MIVEPADSNDSEVMTYLRSDVFRNSLDLWNLQHNVDEYQLHICRTPVRILAHLGIYSAPDGVFANLGGLEEGAERLLDLVPAKGVVTVTPGLSAMVRRKIRFDAVYPNDIMTVERGREVLPESSARRLTVDFAAEYSTFGSSFNAQPAPLAWSRIRLEEDFIFGAFSGAELVSVASLAAWLPEVAVVMGVETKKGSRRRGFGTSVVAAAVREGLNRSELVSLFVRSDNWEAIGVYRNLGFQKIGEDYWIDIGTGLLP